MRSTVLVCVLALAVLVTLQCAGVAVADDELDDHDTAIVDVIAEGYALLEVDPVGEGVHFRTVPVDELPADVEEGDVLRRVNGDYERLEVLTEERRQEAAERFAELAQRLEEEPSYRSIRPSII